MHIARTVLAACALLLALGMTEQAVAASHQAAGQEKKAQGNRLLPRPVVTLGS